MLANEAVADTTQLFSDSSGAASLARSRLIR